jgi:transposase
VRGKRGASLDPAGYDAGKKIKGRKRRILVDTLGLLLSVDVYPADVQDRDGAAAVLREARRRFPFIERLYADGCYRGPKMARAVEHTGQWKLEIVKRCDLHLGSGRLKHSGATPLTSIMGRAIRPRSEP